MSLVKLADIKTWLGIDQTDTTQDAILVMAQKSVEQAIINYCETDFDSHTVTNEMFDGGRADTIVPKGYPIIKVNQIRFGTNPDGTAGTALNTTTDYLTRPDSIKFKNLYTPIGNANVALDYTYGYDSVPSDIAMAVLLSVEAFIARKSRGTIGISSRSKNGEAERYSSGWDTAVGLPNEVVSMIRIYKPIEFPIKVGSARNL